MNSLTTACPSFTSFPATQWSRPGMTMPIVQCDTAGHSPRQASGSLLGSAQDMEGISKELVDIMRDGIIDTDERVQMISIVDTLNAISHMIEEIKCALNSSETS